MIPSHKAPVNKFLLSHYSKHAGKNIRKHSFGGLAADTLTSCESTLFESVSRISWGGGGGGGLLIMLTLNKD
jgi:hypothetical protein